MGISGGTKLAFIAQAAVFSIVTFKWVKIMVEVIAQMSAGAVPMPEAAQPPVKPVAVDPADVKTFSLMMDNGAGNNAAVAPHTTGSGGSDLARSIISQGTEFRDSFHSLDTKRQELVTDMSDPMMTMARATEFSFQSTTLFTHLNLASGLATAVNNSFNSLFKNQS